MRKEGEVTFVDFMDGDALRSALFMAACKHAEIGDDTLVTASMEVNAVLTSMAFGDAEKPLFSVRVERTPKNVKLFRKKKR